MSTTLAERAKAAARAWYARLSVEEVRFSASEARDNAALVREICAHADDESIWEADESIHDFVGDVPTQLAEAGLLDEALTLLTLFEESFEGGLDDFVAERSLLLAKHGRTDEARAIVDEILSDAEGNPDEIARVVETVAVYDRERAEAMCRVVLDASVDALSRFAATATLADLLRARGANDEADALEEALDHEGSIEFSESEPPSGLRPSERPPIRNETPKVGRNDRCPCGSGKKYKKCHGA